MTTARQDPRIDTAQTVSAFLWADDVAEPEFTIGGYADDHLALDEVSGGSTP